MRSLAVLVDRGRKEEILGLIGTVHTGIMSDRARLICLVLPPQVIEQHEGCGGVGNRERR